MQIELVLTIIGIIISLISLYYKIHKDIDDKISKAIEQGDAKRAKIYEHIEKEKAELVKEINALDTKLMQDFTQIKVCRIIHDNSDKNFSRLEGKVDTIGEKLDKLIEQK